LIEKLGALAAPGAPVQTADMVHLKIRLVQNTPDGPPAVGYDVHVRRPGAENSPEVMGSQIQDKSGADGIVDCGLIRFGNFLLYATTPWGERTEVNFYVRAGRPEQVETIVCPDREPEQATVAFAFDVPEDLRDRVVAACFQISPDALVLRGFQWR